VHLQHHQQTEREAVECRLPELHRHLQWSESRTRQVSREAVRRGLVSHSGELLLATAEGLRVADAALLGDERQAAVANRFVG
jgi:hypothetical protein